ncbi:endo-alpha-N-acetylgalactosaminidase family protein [Paenibacillus sp. GCM10023252]|uniref:endo-alpha-N-acetylgalactosaminidase family protein n=1 Tax=Paenibacillus sp. GCM10023252 TaxID=3252649 RepID=UPI0036143B04
MSKGLRLFIVITALLVFGMLSNDVGSADHAAAAGSTEAGETLTIENGVLSVLLDRQFPRVIEYEWGSTGKIMHGQDEKLTQVKINSKLYTPIVSYTNEIDHVNYRLNFTDADLLGVVIHLKFKVNDNVLEMNVTDIIDPNQVVRYLEFPNHGLISIRSTQPGAAVSYNSNFVNGDKFIQAADRPADSAPVKVGHVILNTSELAASIESDMTSQYNYLQTKQKGSYKETVVWNIDFMYRGPDKSVTQLPWVKIAITDDANHDGLLNWQDGALAYRDIMDPMIGENVAQKTIAVNILLNYWGRQSWTWENGLDYVKRQALATDNFPQLMLVKGSHRQYGDGWPSYADNNPLLGGNDQFRWLIEEAGKYNVTVGTHTNSVEAYPESPLYEETPKYNGGVWDLVDRGGTAVDAIEYWSSGLLDERYEAHKEEFPSMKFQYLDVSSGRWDGKEARWTTFKTLQKFKEMDWTYFTEMYLGYVNYTLNSEATNALSPKYMSWVHTYFYGEEKNGGNHGNSDIRRFIINDQAIYEAGSKDYQNVLGAGYQKSYGTLGWSESQKTVDGAVSEFWQHTLADTYLKNFQITSIIRDAANHNYLTAEFKDGVKSVFDGTKRSISKHGVLYATLNDDIQEIFIPWDAKTEEKIYTYSTNGGEKTWTVPVSWKDVTDVNLYRLDETKGKTFVSTIEVEDGKVTIPYDAKQGYVITKELVEQTPILWGDGSIIKDANFNSNSMNIWKASNPLKVAIGDDVVKGNYYLNIAGEEHASQDISQLEAGRSYVISALVRHNGAGKGVLEIDLGDRVISSESLGYHSKTIMGNVFDGWEQLKVYFTASEADAVVRLKGIEGQGSIFFDDVRIYEEDNPYGSNGHYYHEDFETTHSLGGFVHENASLARLAYANNGTNGKVQLNGDMTLMLGGRNNSKIKTLPGLMKLKPNTGYDLSFMYKSSYGPSNGWAYSIYSESTGKKLVNKYLSSYDGQKVTEKVSFKTDAAEDYILVVDNVFAESTNKADLILDDIILDLNPNVLTNPPLQPDNFYEDEYVLVEAEDALLGGSATITQDGAASGMGAVASFEAADTLTFKYMSGGHQLNLKYKNTSSDAQTMDLFINGQAAGRVSFEATDGAYETKEVLVTMPNAATIELVAVQADDLAIDLISVMPTYEAELAERTGYTGEIADAGASGGKMVWINDINRNNSGLTFTIKSEATDLVIRYTNEKAKDRLLDIYVNGLLVKEKVVFPYTGPVAGGKFVYNNLSIRLDLAKGDKLQLKAPVGEANVAMIDYISTKIDESLFVQEITVNQTEWTLNGEANVQIIATVRPENAVNKQLVWSSDQPNVAVVNQGLVSPVGIGTANIKISTADGKVSTTVKVIVKELPIRYKVEAESGTRTNSGTAGTTKGAAGETFIWMNSVNWQTGKVEEASWTYVVEQDGDSLILNYANQLSRNRYLDIYLNGQVVVENKVFPQTGAQIIGADIEIPIALKKGDILKFMAPMGLSDVAMIDYYTIVKGQVVEEDIEKPVTTAHIAQDQPGIVNNWYTSNVTLTLTAGDEGSGLKLTEYRLNGGNWQTYSEPVYLSEEGLFDIQYRSVDKSDNVEEAKSIAINMDKSKPILQIISDKTHIGPPNHKMIPIQMSVIAEDSGSGAAEIKLVAITSNEADNGTGDGNTEEDIQDAEFGTYDTSFLLRAERTGGGGGRVYTITYSVADRAGNMTLNSVEVKVA